MIAHCKNCVGVIDQERNSVVYLVVLNEARAIKTKPILCHIFGKRDHKMFSV